MGAILGFNLENQCSLNELVTLTHAGSSSSPIAQAPLIERLKMLVSSYWNISKKVCFYFMQNMRV